MKALGASGYLIDACRLLNRIAGLQRMRTTFWIDCSSTSFTRTDAPLNAILQFSAPYRRLACQTNRTSTQTQEAPKASVVVHVGHKSSVDGKKLSK